MKKSRMILLSVIMTSLVFNASTSYAENSTTESTKNSEVISSTKETKPSASETSSSSGNSTNNTTESTVETTSTSEVEKEVELPDIKVKEPFSQNFYIRKVMQSEVVDNKGKEQTFESGINGASYKVYNVTHLLSDLSAENENAKLEDIQTELTERSKKLDVGQLELTAHGETADHEGKSGVFKFVSPPSQTHQAFYVVNDAVAENTATLSEPFVIITPVTDEEGNILDNVWIYPKSDPVAAEEEVKEVKKIVSTGIKQDIVQKIIGFLKELF